MIKAQVYRCKMADVIAVYNCFNALFFFSSKKRQQCSLRNRLELNKRSHGVPEKCSQKFYIQQNSVVASHMSQWVTHLAGPLCFLLAFALKNVLAPKGKDKYMTFFRTICEIQVGSYNI